jgi:nicotinamide phosphoribosyltransferase
LLTKPVTRAEVDEAREFYADHGVPFDHTGWSHIVSAHRGFLPVRIRAVPEGTLVPTGNALVTVESTDPGVFWAVSWLETALLRIWHPINVATLGWHIKRDIMRELMNTCDDPQSQIDFRLHDFGSRGVSSQESAAIGGLAHLINFKGTDTIAALRYARQHYGSPMAGFSIPATEHSTVTSWGRDRECDAYRATLKQYGKPGALFACVSDSYDIYRAIDELWGGELRQEVIDSGATLVVRPDSGVPHVVVPECLRRLDAKFGHTVNSKGCRVLNHVRVIQGDGINHTSINSIMREVAIAGYSIENVAFGMGGALLQQHNRDTQKFAMKCSSVHADGQDHDVYKDPVTDPGKRSKRGRLDLVKHTGWSDKRVDGYETLQLPEGQISYDNSCMHTVYENGVLYNEETLDTIRERARSQR